MGVTMYRRILLAYDGSAEGRTALREGALLARQCGADVFLLSVLADAGTLLFAEATLAGASVRLEDDFMDILNEGVARLQEIGFRSGGQTGERRARRRNRQLREGGGPILSSSAIADRARLTAGGYEELSDGLHRL